MTGLLLNAAYIAAALAATPLLAYRKLRHGKGVARWREKLTGRVDLPPKTNPRVWIHAVSVGEVLQLRPLIEELGRVRPDAEVVITSTTATGLKLADERYPACPVVPLPLDFTWSVDAAVDRIRPDAVCLVELELWPNLVRRLSDRGVPLLLTSGRLSENSHRGYRRVRPVIAPLLRRFDWVGAQTDEYADRFCDLGADPACVVVSGSLKHDRQQTDRGRPEVLRLRSDLGLSDDDLVFVAGSTHEGEERVALAAYERARESCPELRLILVPRHPERFDVVANEVEAAGHSLLRRSQQESEPPNATVILLDTVGELSACWALADIAFVGGSLTNRGGQNMLEPAAVGAAVILGPNTWNFPSEMAALTGADACVVLEEESDLTTTLIRFASSPADRGRLGTAARKAAAQLSGAAAVTAAQVASSLADLSRRAAA